MLLLNSDEQLDDLQIGGLKIIQKKKGFKFGTDAVLLSHFAKSIKSDNTLDLCTGSAIIPLLLSAKTKTPHFSAVEIQSDIADMAKRSVKLNGLSEKISVYNEDLKNATDYLKKRQFDLITCNPPYMRAGSAVPNLTDAKLIARHEVMCTLEDIIKQASQLVSLTGHFVMVHRPERLCDCIALMRKYRLEPKRLRFVHKSVGYAPTLFLIDGLYNGKSDLKILPPLNMYCLDGTTPTGEFLKIYGKI